MLWNTIFIAQVKFYLIHPAELLLVLISCFQSPVLFHDIDLQVHPAKRLKQ